MFRPFREKDKISLFGFLDAFAKAATDACRLKTQKKRKLDEKEEKSGGGTILPKSPSSSLSLLSFNNVFFHFNSLTLGK